MQEGVNGKGIIDPKTKAVNIGAYHSAVSEIWPGAVTTQDIEDRSSDRDGGNGVVSAWATGTKTEQGRLKTASLADLLRTADGRSLFCALLAAAQRFLWAAAILAPSFGADAVLRSWLFVSKPLVSRDKAE